MSRSSLSAAISTRRRCRHGQQGPHFVALPMPAGLTTTVQQLAPAQLNIKTSTVSAAASAAPSLLLLFLLRWSSLPALAPLYLSKRFARPVEALADAMNAVGEGQYEQRITVSATAELGGLVRSFDHMASDLEQSRERAVLPQSVVRGQSYPGIAPQRARDHPRDHPQRRRDAGLRVLDPPGQPRLSRPRHA